MRSKILLVSHFNYSKAGSIHGPVHTIGSYLTRQRIPYTYLGYPLYVGEKSIISRFNGIKETTKKFGGSLKLPLPIQSLYETINTLNFLRKYKNDLVVAVDPLNALATICAKKIGLVKKVIFYTVDYTPNRFSNKVINNLYHQIDRFCIRNADTVWNVSHRIVEKRREQGIPDSRNIYVPNAPSIKVGKPLPASKVDRFNIVMVTGITHSPAFSMVINAISELVEKFPKIKLSLIGAGSYEEELKRKVSNSKLRGHVEFLGQLEHEPLLGTLPKAGLGLAIYTSDYSWVNYGDSMKAREYLLSGLPTIITDVVSTGEDIKSYDAGFVVKPTKKAIQNAIAKLMQNKNVWENKRNNALKLAKDQDIDKILNRVFLPLI